MGSQMVMNALVAVSNTIDGVEMGVMEDGTPFLTGRGLARLCGVAHSSVIRQSDTWFEGGRSGRLPKMVMESGWREPELFIKTEHKGQEVHAYPDSICILFLEYYAFEIDPPSEMALRNYRRLGRTSLRLFIYSALGYDPNDVLSGRWKQFHDRMLLNNAPAGYFSIFKEISEVVLAAIKGGLLVDHHTVPDISVGRAWSTEWMERGLDAKHGQRKHHPHVYPDYFPQALSNPVDAWVYPNAALGEFRDWMQQEYLPTGFPKYLSGKVEKGAIASAAAAALLKEISLSAPTQISGDADE